MGPGQSRERPTGPVERLKLALHMARPGDKGVQGMPRWPLYLSPVLNGPYWDNHVVDVVPESDVEARARTRLMHQASRRVIHRGRSAVDQDFILALQNQVDREHDRDFNKVHMRCGTCKRRTEPTAFDRISIPSN